MGIPTHKERATNYPAGSCMFCHGPTANYNPMLCDPCIKGLVGERNFANVRDDFYPLTIKKEQPCPTTSK